MTRVEGVRSETAVLVGVLLPNRKFQHDPLDELTGLARTVGAGPEGAVRRGRVQVASGGVKLQSTMLHSTKPWTPRHQRN